MTLKENETMRYVDKGMRVELTTGEHKGRTGTVLRGANCQAGTGRATVKLYRHRRKSADLVQVSVRSCRWVADRTCGTVGCRSAHGHKGVCST